MAESIAQPAALGLTASTDTDVRSTGDAEAVVLRLFDTHAGGLRRYVCRCGLTPDAADDVVQDAFVALFRHLQNGGNADNLPGWLVQVCFRLALKARHRSARRSAQEQPLDDGAFDVPDSERSVEARLLDQQRRQWVAAVVQALPERDRQCVSMRAEGVTYRTIAQELGMSLGGVAKAIARAAARLSRGIKE
ncbi:MAG: sigma-70 family RNA polymerase sigma factor [Vicinamibacterales bacterium]